MYETVKQLTGGPTTVETILPEQPDPVQAPVVLTVPGTALLQAVFEPGKYGDELEPEEV